MASLFRSAMNMMTTSSLPVRSSMAVTWNNTTTSSNGGITNGVGFVLRRWAFKATAGSSDNGRKSAGRRLGLKKQNGEYAIPGNIIYRQRGYQIHPGKGVGTGRDHTLFALVEGTVEFYDKKGNFKLKRRDPCSVRKYVKIVEPKKSTPKFQLAGVRNPYNVVNSDIDGVNAPIPDVVRLDRRPDRLIQSELKPRVVRNPRGVSIQDAVRISREKKASAKLRNVS